MTIEQTIQKSIEGGYVGISNTYHKWDGIRTFTAKEVIKKCPEVIFLDPKFWQALGKALGWKQKYTSMIRELRYDDVPPMRIHAPEYDEWMFWWHRFIDHLAEDKDAESFFKELG